MVFALAGLTLFGKNDPKEFEEILDNLIADEPERLFHRTTQVEAPLFMTVTLQQYIAYTGREKHAWEKYGATPRGFSKATFPAAAPRSRCIPTASCGPRWTASPFPG